MIPKSSGRCALKSEGETVGHRNGQNKGADNVDCVAHALDGERTFVEQKNRHLNEHNGDALKEKESVHGLKVRVNINIKDEGSKKNSNFPAHISPHLGATNLSSEFQNQNVNLDTPRKLDNCPSPRILILVTRLVPTKQDVCSNSPAAYLRDFSNAAQLFTEGL